MHETRDNQRWFWATLVLSSLSIVALVFAFWEVIENRFFRDLDYMSLHYLYISRGIASALFLAVWAAWFVRRDRRKTERELRRSREHYRGLLEASPGAVVLFDSDLIVREWNHAAERLYGFGKDEVLQRKLPTIPPEGDAELREFMGVVAQGEELLEQETRRRHKQGHAIEVQLSLLPFREAGAHYFLELTFDIRERVRLRERLIEFEKLTTMGEMAAGTAHHLNTPLASMLLRVQMMHERAHDELLASDLGRLEQSIGFCQQFVRRLLDFSRRPTVRHEPEEIGPLVDAVLGFLSPSFLAKQAKVNCEGRPEMQVLADRNSLETLLLILLSNALDAIPAGGAIAVKLGTNDGHLEISVRDNGCGIAAADRALIFEPFFTTKPVGKGTGLGLPIAKNIVNQHGGEIDLESEPGNGTCVRVRLPVHTAREAEVQP